ncbi:hypothetical protein FB567DRAFT_592315 [Paraphoma chrysanthemicola]|uniref:Uncharacterized protein n=1 Tax=Paraphoma chrysanthemicola TaxID=798071 RepID=A0A8K0VYK5_9PLEO|nr:hypothetical protein FB567DRAFT_592315 [Paraphoma chrysanthemicola]
MSHYHNNQLNVVGLDSELDDATYTPTKAIKAHKRKRNAKLTMHDTNTKSGGDVKNGAMQDDGGSNTALNNVGPPFLGGQEFPPPSLPATFASQDAQDYDFSSYFDYNPIDYSVMGSNMWNQDQAAGEGYDLNAMGSEVEITDALIDAANEVNSDDEDEMFYGNDNADKGQSKEQDGGDNIQVKQERGLGHPSVSPFPHRDSDYEESDYEERRPSKAPKLNKDGGPRKPRQPRPKLLKWDDNDWKNVALGLVWACGENGIQIPFQQASQVVSESCSAGALQQALLKLRGKQIAEGYQIPSLRMAWTRKNKNGSSSTSSANTKSQDTGTKNMLPRKKPTRFVGNQSLIVTLKRAYRDTDRLHLVYPHKVSSAASKAKKPSLAPPQPLAFGAGMMSTPMYQPPSMIAGNLTPAVSPTESAQEIMSNIQRGLTARFGPSTPPATPTKPNHRRNRHVSVSTPKPILTQPTPGRYKGKRSTPRRWQEPKTPTIPELQQFPADGEVSPFPREDENHGDDEDGLDFNPAKNLTETMNLILYGNMPPDACNPNGPRYHPNNNDFGGGGPGHGGGIGGGFGGNIGASVPYVSQDMWT